MQHNTQTKKKIKLPEELLCAYIDGTTTPQEDREMLAMLASDKHLARLKDDLQAVMDIINMSEDDVKPLGCALPTSSKSAAICDADDVDAVSAPELFEINNELVVDCCNASLDLKALDDFERMCEETSREEECKMECQKRIHKHRIVPPKSERRRSDSTYNNFNLSASRSKPHSRVSPFMVNKLAPNEIFVFGSNPWGLHNGGASKLAKRNFGAIQGQGEGRQGQSYAIPTIVGGVENIRPHVNRFLEYAAKHPELHFIVTLVGCGTAGFNPEDIAPLFVKAKEIPNISLPQAFWRVIGLPE